jgi:pimeloyl-ACP methyl ester carboxylesterase
VTDERLLTSRGVTICYDVHGRDGDPTVLLVMGLNLQLVWWRQDLLDELVGRGLRVVRMDNRDVGRSTRLRGPGPTAWQLVRRTATPAYSLADMAADCAAVLAEVAPGGGHVAGVSLGAFVAQELAIRHRVLSLTSIMGRPGDGRTGKVAPRMTLEMLRPPPRDPVAGLIRSFRTIGSTFRTGADDRDVVTCHEASMRRSADESGGGRQLAAILTERDRTADLAALRLPALVMHGLHDRVVRPDGGRATAAALHDAELVEVPGMGHDLARQVWPQLVDGVVRTVARA